MRRNLPPAAIGDLKLEEKEIVARRAKKRQGKRTDLAQANIPPNLGEGGHDGETLEILARDIPMGRESLRKLDGADLRQGWHLRRPAHWRDSARAAKSNQSA